MIEKFTQRRGLFLILISLILISINGCISGDEGYQEMPLDEAQELLLFEICLPKELPSGIYREHLVEHQADFDDPHEGNVTIDFLSLQDQKHLMTLYERYAPGRFGKPPDDIEFHQRVLRRDLLAWMLGWEQVDRKLSLVTDVFMIHESENKIEYRALEITDPSDLQAVLVSWTMDPVIYYVYSKESIELTLLFAQSIVDCNER